MPTLHLKPWLCLYTDTYSTIHNMFTLYLKPWVYFSYADNILNSPLDGY